MKRMSFFHNNINSNNLISNSNIVTSTEVERSIKEEISPFRLASVEMTQIFFNGMLNLFAASPIRKEFDDIFDFILDIF